MYNNENMMTLREACEHLRISEATMRRFLSKASINGIPYHRVGVGYRFYKSELSQWASGPVDPK